MDYYNAFREIDNRNVHDLFFEVQNVLIYNIGENRTFSLNDLSILLKKRYKNFSLEDLKMVLKIFNINFEKIVRIDRWNQDELYMLLDERHEQHNYQRSFYDFKDNNPTLNKKFIVIADTHIGNKNIQNFKLIHNIYDLAIKNNIKYVFHLGDIFQRVDDINIDDRYSKAMEYIESFMNEYPNMCEEEIKTFSVLGNHDLTIHGSNSTDVFFDNNKYYEQLFNLQELSKDNPSFLVYARRTFAIDLNNIPIHFSHRLYIDSYNRDKKINSVGELADNDSFCKYPICISGHLHRGILYIGNDYFCNEHLYIGVPSTSNININNVVGYIIELDVDSMVNIKLLYSKENSSIYLGEEYNYNINERNKVLKKEFK